jgi:hypothetical protein
MIIDLGYSRAVSGEKVSTFFIGFDDILIYIGRICLQPVKQRWAKVKADICVVIGYVNYFSVGAENSGSPVLSVALLGNSHIPIVKRVSGILEFHSLQPGIFPRWLVKMSVNTYITIHLKLLNLIYDILKAECFYDKFFVYLCKCHFLNLIISRYAEGRFFMKGFSFVEAIRTGRENRRITSLMLEKQSFAFPSLLVLNNAGNWILLG